MKDLINDENNNVIVSKDLTNSILVIFILMILIISAGSVAFFFLQKDINEIKDELTHTKEVLSEYGIYIDGQPAQEDSYDTSAYKIINPSDIEKESKGKTIVVWIGRQSCGYCTMFEPYIREASSNYGIKSYYIDLASMIEFNAAQPYITNEVEFNLLSNLKGEGKWDGFANENVGGTPLTLVIKNNKVIGGLSGYADTNTVMQVFAEAGLKKN